MSVSTGIKDVLIKIHCDSPRTPEVPLTLRLVGERKPPYLHVIFGDFTFRGRFTPDMSRTLTAVTIETEGPTAEPALTTDLPFLSFKLEETSSQPYPGRSTIARKRVYRVGFREKPPSMTFSGEVSLGDPWDNSLNKALRVFGELDASLRVSPATIELVSPNGGVARLLVLSDDPITSLDVRQETAATNNLPLNIQVGRDGVAAKVHTISIELSEHGSNATGLTRVRIRARNRGDEIVVPIRVVSPN